MNPEFWNEKFSGSIYRYGRKPNRFFKEFIDTITPGKLLVPGDGEGRNSVYAALRGWEVTAFDYSSVAREKAEQLAALNKVWINYFEADLEDVDLTDETFDCIALLYVHLNSRIRRKIHQKLIPCLKPNGQLILEGFSKEQINHTSGGPKNPDMLYELEDIVEDFHALAVSHLAEETTILDEGQFHRGKASVIRMIGRKPNKK